MKEIVKEKKHIEKRKKDGKRRMNKREKKIERLYIESLFHVNTSKAVVTITRVNLTDSCLHCSKCGKHL